VQEHADAYRSLRARVTEVVRATDPARMEEPAPACTGWRAKDVLAHLVGVPADVAADRMEGVATDAWTQAQVEARLDVPVDDLLAEWNALGPGFEERLASLPGSIAGQPVFDAWTHEHDFRSAIGAPGAREGDALDLGWAWFVGGHGRTLTAQGRPALRVVSEAGEEVLGEGEPAATVRASRFDLLRAMTGRRSETEIAAFDWDPAPRPDLLLVIPIFRMRTEPLAE